LLVLSGPSGVGKTTIAKKLRDAGIPRVMTTTTRAPRGTEKNGVEYRFLTRQEFEDEIIRPDSPPPGWWPCATAPTFRSLSPKTLPAT
jgi:guanylate kinase